MVQGFGDGSKHMRKVVFSDVEDALLLWLKVAHSKGVPVISPLLKAKVHKLVQDMRLEFACTDDWINCFRKCKMSFLYHFGQSKYSLLTIVWMRSCLVCCCIMTKDTSNADEMGLLYKMLPERTYIFACHWGSALEVQWWWLPTWMRLGETITADHWKVE